VISVAMPYFNRPQQWAMSKASYAKVYPLLDIEFSICDDGSTPPLADPDARVIHLPQK